MPYTYNLGGSAWAGTRLRFQDSLTKTNFSGHRLDPSVTIKDGMRIADVATGTGAWALDVADLYPDVEIEGLDINLSEVPAKGYWPKHCTFREFDLLQEVEEEWVDRYDAVNVQYIMPIVRDDDFLTILGRLMQMLKPGGCLQWTDANTNKWSWFTPQHQTIFESRAAIGPELAPILVKSIHLAMEIIGVRSKQQTWLDRMEEGFREVGILDVKHVVAVPKPSTVQALTMNWIWTMDEGFMNMRARIPEKKALVDEWFELRPRLLEEVKERSIGMNTAMTRCVGRKPTWTKQRSNF